MSELNVATQRLAADLSASVYFLLASDSVWTQGLSEHSAQDRDALASVGRQMADVLRRATAMANALAAELEGHRLESLLSQGSAGVEWPASVPASWAADLADLFPRIVEILNEHSAEEAERLTAKANHIESGEWTEGDLTPPLDCTLLGASAVAALGCIPLSAGICGPIAAGIVATFFGGGCATQLRKYLRRTRRADQP